MSTRTLIQPHILAGGDSTRFGGDKRVHRWRGRPLIGHVLDAFDLAFSPEELWVGVRSSAAAGPLLPHLRDYPTLLLEDREDLEGPLASLATALTWGVRAQRDWVFTCAVDLPAVTPALLAGLADLAARSPDAAAILPRPAHDGWPRLQPLCALYRPAPALEALDAFAASGQRSVTAFAHTLPSPLILDSDDLAEIEPRWRRAFANINTPQDLQTLDDEDEVPETVRWLE